MLLTVLTGLWSWQSACNFGDARVFIVFIKATILKPFIFLRHNAGPKRRSQSKCAAVLTVFVNRATEHKNAATQHVFVTFVKWIKLIYVIPRVWQRALPRLYRVIHNSMAHFTKNRYTSRGGKNCNRRTRDGKRNSSSFICVQVLYDSALWDKTDVQHLITPFHSIPATGYNGQFLRWHQWFFFPDQTDPVERQCP